MENQIENQQAKTEDTTAPVVEVAAPPQPKTKAVTKAKNPKRVEQGKRLAARNAKMKEQILKMQNAENETVETTGNTQFDHKTLIGLGLIVAAVGLYYLRNKKSTPIPPPPTQPTQPATQPVAPPTWGDM